MSVAFRVSEFSYDAISDVSVLIRQLVLINRARSTLPEADEIDGEVGGCIYQVFPTLVAQVRGGASGVSFATRLGPPR